MAKISNLETINITERFSAATRAIQPGTLVKDEFFSLFEAVGALEIGDAKMDSGFLQPGETLEHEFDVMAPLMPEELIWLMDQMLNREVAWYMGYPLSQTLFTSVHIDKLLWPAPTSLEESTFVRSEAAESMPLTQKLLRLYCLLLIKSGDFVLNMVRSQHFYEEEDFTTQLFNRELLTRIPTKEITDLCPALLHELSDAVIADDLKTAIRTRIQFRIDTLNMLDQQFSGNIRPISVLALQSSLDMQEKSNSLGKPLPDAFSTKLQRHLASTVPPRPMVTVSMVTAWSFWQQMIADCNQVFAIFAAGHSHDLFTAYQIFGYRRPELSTYSKSLQQSFLDMDGLVAGRLSPAALIQEDLRSFTLPDRNSFSLNPIRIFIEKCEQPFVNIYRALCLNGCRIRRTFCHALAEWDMLQLDGEDLDAALHETLKDRPQAYDHSLPPQMPFRLSSWAYHHKLLIHEQIIQMGFEQMIYAPHELVGMYWYLSYICDTHLNHLERVSHFTSAQRKEKEDDDFKLALERQFREYAKVKSTQLLARALYLVYAVLKRHGIFVLSSSLYSTQEHRHEIRMKPFARLSIPEPLPSDVFEENISLDEPTEDLLDTAARLAVAAKKSWEEVSKRGWHLCPTRSEGVVEELWAEDVKNCVKSAIATGLCVTMLKKNVGSEEWLGRTRKEAKVADVDEKNRWHRWWIVPVMPAA